MKKKLLTLLAVGAIAISLVGCGGVSQEEVTELNNKVTEYETKITELETKVTELETTVGEKDEALKQKDEKIKIIIDEKAKVEEAYNSLKNSGNKTSSTNKGNSVDDVLFGEGSIPPTVSNARPTEPTE